MNGETFSVRVTGILIAVGVLLAGIFALLTAYGSELTGGNDGGGHALSRGATGFSAVVALAPAMGTKVRLSRDEHPGAAGLLVLTPPLGTDPAKLAALLKGREDAVLVVLPKWQTMPLPLHKGWVQTTGTLPPIGAVMSLTQAAPGTGAALLVQPPRQLRGTGDVEGLAFDTPAEPRAVSGKELVPEIIGSDGQIVLGWLPKHNLYVLADPDLINNHGLRTPEQARAAEALLARLGGSNPGGLVFDVTLNGFAREQNLLRTALEPPFLAMTLALLIAAGLTLWQGSVRFGTAQTAPRAIAFGKRALVDNAAALIRMARREPALAERYAAQVRDAAALTLGAPPGLTGRDLGDWLDKRGSGTKLADLAYEAALATDRASALKAARALYQWQQDVTHDTR